MAQKIITSVALMAFWVSGVSAQETPFDFSRYQEIRTFQVEGIQTPKVVIYQTNDPLVGPIALQDSEGNFLSYRTANASSNQELKFGVTSAPEPFEGTLNAITDQNLSTFASFAPALNQATTLTLSLTKPSLIDQLVTHLDTNSIYPKKVTLEALVNDQWVTLLEQQPFSLVVKFPAIETAQLRVTYWSPNLLRINGIQVGQQKNFTQNQVIFYAEEGRNYRLWSHPKFGQKTPPRPASSQPLRTDSQTPVFPLTAPNINPVFNDDFDLDGLSDGVDLCPRIADPENLDIDNNGKGDVCEDPDQDGVNSSSDNCPFVYNPSQSDIDLDDLGDECDEGDDRRSEQFPWITTVGFLAMALALIALLAVSALRDRKTKP